VVVAGAVATDATRRGRQDSDAASARGADPGVGQRDRNTQRSRVADAATIAAIAVVLSEAARAAGPARGARDDPRHLLAADADCCAATAHRDAWVRACGRDEAAGAAAGPVVSGAACATRAECADARAENVLGAVAQDPDVAAGVDRNVDGSA